MLVRSEMAVRCFVQRGTRMSLTIDDVQLVLRPGPDPDLDSREILLVQASREVHPDRDVLDALAQRRKDSAFPLPISVLDYTDGVHRTLGTATRRAVEVLRWTTGSDMDHSPYLGLGAWYQSEPGQDLVPLPGRGDLIGFAAMGVPLDAASQRATQISLDAGLEEPVGHSLVREALASLFNNQRSAVVMGVAAAETGFKGLVADLVPEATWLAIEVPSPPLRKMLRDFLPTLPARLTIDGVVHPPPKSALRQIDDLVAERNRIAHQGTQSIGRHSVKDALLTVRNTLYLFDYYAGNAWALAEIDPAYLGALRAQSARR